jgi:DNA-binding SARP family transcriptional activator
LSERGHSAPVPRPRALEVRVDGISVSLGGAKQRVVLAVLLLHANQVVSIERLIDDVWG